MVQNVGMPVGNVQMQSQQQQNTNQPQQYQQVNMILSNQTVMRPNQTSQPQQQQTVNVAFTPQFQQGQQFYIQQQPAQMQPISVPSGGPPRIYHLQTTPNGPQQVFVGQPQNIRPQTFNFPSQSLQQRPIGSSGPPTRLVTINQQQSGGNTNVNRPVYQPMPPQSFSIPSAQSQQPHQQTKLTDTSASK